MDNLKELLKRSRDGLKRIQQIVKDLRDFARLDETDWHEVQLNEGIESSVRMIAAKAQAKHVQIELDLGCLPPVACYPGKINQVVMNLLSNAIDACSEGGQVHVSSTLHDGQVMIEVTDNGCGIPASILPRIFDPFFTTKKLVEGTG